ncbi:hypothetical protein ACO22_06397 [Paracoccidioides brasiliensis]|uniref:Uncharacterized protein n=1 Tax=Paracoccidioides brasiliensis TaxID=121759 RepID=A0A1D2J7P0_PARBR|nr:hypothetical protein ACO22_06397 [Paracoccidioides brasiliensis]
MEVTLSRHISGLMFMQDGDYDNPTLEFQINLTWTKSRSYFHCVLSRFLSLVIEEEQIQHKEEEIGPHENLSHSCADGFSYVVELACRVQSPKGSIKAQASMRRPRRAQGNSQTKDGHV